MLIEISKAIAVINIIIFLTTTLTAALTNIPRLRHRLRGGYCPRDDRISLKDRFLLYLRYTVGGMLSGLLLGVCVGTAVAVVVAVCSSFAFALHITWMVLAWSAVVGVSFGVSGGTIAGLIEAFVWGDRKAEV